MASVIKGIFIDVNKSVEVNIKIDGKKLSFDLVYSKEKEADIGFRNYISNIRKMLKIEYHKGQDGKINGIGVYLGKFKLGEITSYQLFGIVDKNAKYNAIHYINSTEERFLSQGNLQNIENLGVPFERQEGISGTIIRQSPKKHINLIFTFAPPNNVYWCSPLVKETIEIRLKPPSAVSFNVISIYL